MINITDAKKLDIILPNTNKALNEVLKNASAEELKVLSKEKDLKSILNSILKQSALNRSGDKTLVQLMKNNPTLKSLGDVSSTIKDLLSTIRSQTNPLPIEKILKNFLVDIKDLSNTKLKQMLENSGIFLESSLKKLKPLDSHVKELLSQDLKAVLLSAKEELSHSNHVNRGDLLKQMDKLLLQIDYYQLLSHLSNASSLYLPFSWDAMQEGSIQMKKTDDDKFYCDIDLKLKKYGEVNFKLTLYEKNQLNLHIYAKSKTFQMLMKEKMSELRSAIISVNVTPREIRVFEPKSTNATQAYNEYEDNLAMKFEVKG